LKFAHPAWLILLVLLPLLGAGAFAVARLRRRQWAEFVAPRLRPTLLRRGNPLPRWFALALLLAACAAIIAALARPYADAGSRTEKSLGRNVLIAIDLSRSMRVTDVKPDRLTQAKVVIYELLEAMPNERIGLIGFAGDAYEYAPLTVDHNAVRETVEQLDETWAPMGGSNLAEAVRLATDTLRKTGQKNNALVIISDGDQNDGDLDDMIYEARHSGVYVLAVGVGTEDGNYVPNADFPGNRMIDRSGKAVISQLHPDVMRKLASETRGSYATAGSGANIPALVKSAIKDLDAFEMEGRERAISIEFYQWLLFPAILFLLGAIVAGTRWRGVNATTIALAICVLTTVSTRADEVSAAKQALQQKRYPDARDAYRNLAENHRSEEMKARFRIGEATAAYRNGDFRDACAAYSQALLTDHSGILEASHLGLGASLFQVGWKNLAGKAYPSNAADVPDMKSFDDQVRKLLADMNSEKTEAKGAKTIKAIVTNWVDAIRHYDSGLDINPTNRTALENRRMIMTYLKRLRELLEEENQKTEDSIPPPDPEQSDPKLGNSEETAPKEDPKEQPKEKPDGDQGDKNKPTPKPSDGKDGDDQNPKPKSGDKEEDPNAENGSKKEKPKNESKDGKAQNPNPDETPEDQAKRILKENADMEKGPLTPGRREFRNPEKDW